MITRSEIRKLAIREAYRLNLLEQLYEQAAPTPADPADPAAAAPATTPDPAAAAATTPPDPAAAAAAAPPVPPPGAAAPPPTPVPGTTPDPAAAAAASPPPPAPAGAPPPPGSPPAVDPMAALASSAMTTPPGGAVPPAPPAPGAAPPTPPVPGAPATPVTAAKPASKPAPGTTAGAVASAVQDAIAAATGDTATESLRRRSLKFLMEQETQEPSIDINVYAGKIANLIKNYTSLIDVKKNVIDQAEKFIDEQFPKSAEKLKKDLKDLLRKEYHISLERPEEPEAPLAVGATKSGGGAG